MPGVSAALPANTAGFLSVLPLLGLLIAGAIPSAVSAMPKTGQTNGNLIETTFAALDGWSTDDHSAALSSWLRFCREPYSHLSAQQYGLSVNEAAALCRKANAVDTRDPAAARAFFEENFTPFRVTSEGFVTGYFEPEVAASRTPTTEFSSPLLKAPSGLEAVPVSAQPKGWPQGRSHGRRTKEGLVPLPDRGEIMDGALSGENLEFVWLLDPVDAFFIHVQGSARLRLRDGSVMRVGYAGKTGHAYTSVARVLVERGEGTPEELTMAGLRRWFNANPDRRDALLRENRSFIFFREVDVQNPDGGPIGAANIPLIAGRSVAIDPAHISYGTPIFVTSELTGFGAPDKPFRRLLIADDTGSAIKGPARGDIFAGSGKSAGDIAGNIRHRAEFIVLLPKGAKQ